MQSYSSQQCASTESLNRYNKDARNKKYQDRRPSTNNKEQREFQKGPSSKPDSPAYRRGLSNPDDMAKRDEHRRHSKQTNTQAKDSVSSETPRTETESHKAKKNTEKQNDQPMKNTTIVYILITDAVKESEVKGFLESRIGSKVSFNVVSSKISDSGAQTNVMLQFLDEELAATAMKCIDESNIDSNTKISCSLIPLCANKGSNQDKINETIVITENQVTEYLENHQQKIKEVSEQLEQFHINANVSVKEYQRRVSEREALTSKVDELKLQEKEFKDFVSKWKLKLSTVTSLPNFDTFFSAECKAFGIECRRLKNALPIYARRSEIVECVKQHQVTIIRGSTGSGKSTQLTQYLYEANLANDKIIVCTQPRKVACTSLASRVSEELLDPLSKKIVQSKTSMTYKVSTNTKILFMTDHALLNECLEDPLLSKYSIIIIDEAHERSIYTDLLLGIVKKCLPKRPDLKVIISSATINIKVFADYFQNSQSLEIARKKFPVEVIWQSIEDEARMGDNYVEEAVQTAITVHTNEGHGDVLVFLTTPLEVERCKESFEKKMKDSNDFECFPLHGQLTPQEQQLVFSPTSEGKRKVVFATNSAETSITIPGIKFVIDTGLAKEMKFDPKRIINSLNIEIISQSSAEQRKGRAGRTSAGKCYRLYTEKCYDEMRTSNVPEILRVHLGLALLKLLQLNVNPSDCDFVESPSPEAIDSAIGTLVQLQAIADGKITEVGKWLAQIPLEPRLGSIIKSGRDKGLLFDSVVVATLMSMGGSVFFRGRSEEDKRKSDEITVQFCQENGDCLTYLAVYKNWLKVPKNNKTKWCFTNSINGKALTTVEETIKEIINILKREFTIDINMQFSENKDSEDVLKKIILKAYANNIAHFTGHAKLGYYVPSIDQQVYIHPSSALHVLDCQSEWVVFGNVLRTSKEFITIVTPVQEDWIKALNKPSFCIESVKAKKVFNVHVEYLGPVTFSIFVGPKYIKLGQFEKTLSEMFGTTVVLEADRDLGEIRMYSTKLSESARTIITLWAEEARKCIECKSDEFSLSVKNSNGVRIVLGAGGETQRILMPNEYRSVFITKQNSKTTTKDNIINKFSRYGDIIDCWEFKRGAQWGKITFLLESSASEAVKGTENDVHDVAIPERKDKGRRKEEFKARIIWDRRPSKCCAFVDINPVFLARASQLSVLNICGQRTNIGLNKTSDSLRIWRLTKDVMEEDIRDCINSCLGFFTEEDQSHVKKITIVREKGFETTDEDMIQWNSRLSSLISDVIPSDKFVVNLLKPKKPTEINYKAFVSFDEAEYLYTACQAINGRAIRDGLFVKMTPDCISSINISSQIYQVMKKLLDETIDALRKNYNIRCNIKNLLNNERTIFNLYSEKPGNLARSKIKLEEIVKGKVI